MQLLDARDLVERGSIGECPGVGRIAFSQDARRLATAPRESGQVRVWDATNGALLASWPAGAATRLAFSPDGRFLAASAGGAYEIRSTGDWRVVAGVPARRGQAAHRRALAFSPDGGWLAVLLGDADLALVSTRDWKTAAVLPPRSPSVFDTLCFNRDGSLLATGGKV